MYINGIHFKDQIKEKFLFKLFRLALWKMVAYYINIDIGFQGVTISHVTLLCSQLLLYYTECFCNSISTLSTLRLASKHSGQVNI